MTARRTPPLPFSPDPVHALRRMAPYPDPVTLGLYSPAFGGTWRSLLYAAWVQQSMGLRVRVYSQWHGLPWKKDFSRKPRRNRAPLIREILDELETLEPIEVVEEAPLKEVVFPVGVSLLHFPCPRTKIRWKGWDGRRFRRIAYQVEGGYKGVDKNPRPVDLPLLRSFVSGYRWISLGKHMSVRECIEEASTCDFFFGIDSGMQQMCYAIGLPVFLLTYRQDPFILFSWHGDRHAIHCRDTGDFIYKARRFLGLRA